MTEAEVDTQFTVFAIMLSAPYLNGDHGDLPGDIADDIQAILWRYGYLPAQEHLVAEGATLAQVDRATLRKKELFGFRKA